MLLQSCSYIDKAEKSANGYQILADTQKQTEFTLTDAWQTFVAETATVGLPTERVAIRFIVAPGSQVDLDDVYVNQTFR